MATKAFSARRILPLLALPALLPPAVAHGQAMLPLEPGFYVDIATSCGDASNATLSLVHAGGINSARTACDFIEIAREGSTYETVARCTEIGGGPSFEIRSSYEIPESRSYLFTNEHGWSGAARFCAQADLPEPWREVELPD